MITTILHRREAALHKHLLNTNKKHLYQVKKEKVEKRLELAKTRLRVGFEYATYCNQEILSLTHSATQA